MLLELGKLILVAVLGKELPDLPAGELLDLLSKRGINLRRELKKILDEPKFRAHQEELSAQVTLVLEEAGEIDWENDPHLLQPDKLRAHLMQVYHRTCGVGAEDSECSRMIDLLGSLAPLMLEILKDSPGFLKDLSVKVATDVDDVKNGVAENGQKLDKLLRQPASPTNYYYSYINKNYYILSPNEPSIPSPPPSPEQSRIIEELEGNSSKDAYNYLQSHLMQDEELERVQRGIYDTRQLLTDYIDSVSQYIWICMKMIELIPSNLSGTEAVEHIHDYYKKAVPLAKQYGVHVEIVKSYVVFLKNNNFTKLALDENEWLINYYENRGVHHAKRFY